MAPSPHYAPPLLTPSPHSTRSPHHAFAPPQHDDFLGTPSQDPQYLQDTLGLGLQFDYPSNLADETALSSDLATDVTTSRTNNTNSAWDSSQYPTDSLLFTTPYLADLSLSPSSHDIDIHDSYFLQNTISLYNAPSVPRVVPRIRVETEFPSTSSSSNHYHSPYTNSSSAHSPTTIPTSSSTYTIHSASPSSIGSAPPITPKTPYSSVSPSTSPYITHPSPSPVSSTCITVPTGTFNPKDAHPTRMVRKCETPTVLEIADMVSHPLGGPLVPQAPYRPKAISDCRRYIDETQLEEPIMFFCRNPTGCGILLSDALRNVFSNLEGRDDPMFVGRGPSVSIRLNWPGYREWSRQIPTRDFRVPPRPVTRAILARNVARTIKRFIAEQENGHEPKWLVGSKGIKFDDLMLVGLQHVSMGSWQAHVRLVRRH